MLKSSIVEMPQFFDRYILPVKEEFILTQKSTILFYQSLTSEALHREGTSFNTKISALALGFVLVGHQRHHIQVIMQKYLSVTDSL